MCLQNTNTLTQRTLQPHKQCYYIRYISFGACEHKILILLDDLTACRRNRSHTSSSTLCICSLNNTETIIIKIYTLLSATLLIWYEVGCVLSLDLTTCSCTTSLYIYYTVTHKLSNTSLIFAFNISVRTYTSSVLQACQLTLKHGIPPLRIC